MIHVTEIGLRIRAGDRGRGVRTSRAGAGTGAGNGVLIACVMGSSVEKLPRRNFVENAARQDAL